MDKQSICWMTIEADHMASFRYRILKPYQLLNDTFTCSMANPLFFEGRDDFIKADYYVYHKHFNPDIEYAQAKWIKEQFNPQAKIVFDICDDHFDRETGPHYKRMAQLSDIITTTNHRFAKRIKEVTGKDALICLDPISAYSGPVKELSNPRKFVWFGHASNMLYFVQQWQPLLRYKLDLTLYSNGITRDGDNANEHIRTYLPGRVEYELRNYDVALLPQDDSKNETKFKSPNRLVDALSAGLAVITNSEEVYGEFEDFIFFDKNLEAAVNRYMRTDPRDFESKTYRGQQYILKNYNDERIKEQWLSVFKKV